MTDGDTALKRTNKNKELMPQNSLTSDTGIVLYLVLVSSSQRSVEDYNKTLDDNRIRANMLDTEILNLNEDLDELQDKVKSMLT